MKKTLRMKKSFLLASVLCLALAMPKAAHAWSRFLDGSSLPQANGWTLDGDPGTIVDLGGGNSGIRQIDDTVGGYDEWYVVNADQASTLGARFRVDSYGGGPVNILQLTTANSAANPCPAIAVGIRDGRFFLLRYIGDSFGAPPEEARLADLGPLETGIFNEAYLYIDNATDRVRLFWNGSLRFTVVDTLHLFGGGEGYAEFGASNYWPEGDRSGISTVTFDWVGLGNASDLPLNLPFIPWGRYLDGSSDPVLAAPPWQLYQEGDAGTTMVVPFVDPFNGAMNDALQVNSGTGVNDWYDGAFSEDEVFGGARFRLVAFNPTGKENLISMTTRSQPLSPAPSITLVDGRYKLWSYVDPPFGAGNPGSEIMDIGPVVSNEFHIVYLYAKKDGQVKLWWDGVLIFDGMAPLINPSEGYFEWGSGSWQSDATDTVDFDWVAYGAVSPPPALTTVPGDGASFQNASAGFSLTYVSQDGVASNGVSITVNGVNRTGDLVISGVNTNRQGFLGGLVSNLFYQVVLVITELDGDVSTNTVDFDTFSQSNFIFEAEDWNFNGGQFIDNPRPTSMPDIDSYFGTTATEDIDQNELSTDPGASQHAYRDMTLVGTEGSGDMLRQKYLNAQMTDPAVTNYNVGWVEVGEWLNYTRTFPAGTYYIFGRFAYGIIGEFFEATMDKVAGATTMSQTVTPLGVFRGGPGRGWQTYNTVPLTDANTNLLAVRLSGVETLRVTSIEGVYNADYYLLLPVTLRITRTNGTVVISWLGGGVRLQSAPTVLGPWTNVVNQTNPFAVSPTGPARFFRLTQPSPPPPDTVVRFNDLPDGALDGSYAGLDWGTGVWGVGGPWQGINSKNAYQGPSADPATGRIAGGVGGAFLLKSLRATADSAWTITLLDNNGQMFSMMLDAGTAPTLTTGWTMPSDWVDVTSSVGFNAVIDDLTYSR